MAFKQTFEQHLNNDMQGAGQPGCAPSDIEDMDLDIKKGHLTPEQEQFNDSKEQPPRFSTIFGAATKSKPAPAAAPPSPPPGNYEYHREYYGSPPRARRSGVTIPMPLFIIFAIILFFESTILFAYTVIGLYNNAPSRVFPWAGPGTASAVCNTGEQQPSINIAPNFVMPQAAKANMEASVVTVTLSATPTTITASATPSTITASATPSTVTISATPSSTIEEDAAASGIAGILGGLTASSLSAVTATPTRSTVTSVQLITKDPSGNVISGNMVTLTSTTTLPAAAASSAGTITSRDETSTTTDVTPAALTAGATASQDEVGGWAAVSSALENADAAATTSAS